MNLTNWLRFKQTYVLLKSKISNKMSDRSFKMCFKFSCLFQDLLLHNSSPMAGKIFFLNVQGPNLIIFYTQKKYFHESSEPNEEIFGLLWIDLKLPRATFGPRAVIFECLIYFILQIEVSDIICASFTLVTFYDAKYFTERMI